MKNSGVTIAVTAGDPAGIGPDLCTLLAAGAMPDNVQMVIIGDRGLIARRAQEWGVSASALAACRMEQVPLTGEVTAGIPDARHAPHVLAMLDRAVAGCLSGEYAAMVTAPLSKSIINQAALPGLPHFTGHTEYLAEKTGAAHPVMLLAGGDPMLRIALATTHLALRDVAQAITRPGLEQVLRTLHADLQSKFGFDAPRILVAGLNPHAGEGGYLGREEIEVIEPVIARLRSEGMRLTGPLAADTLFTPRHLQDADAVLAMYHDQGLGVLKFASFGRAVNVTLGLPIIRTSVDHGTAFDIAASPDKKRLLDPGSMRAAFDLAVLLATRKKGSA